MKLGKRGIEWDIIGKAVLITLAILVVSIIMFNGFKLAVTDSNEKSEQTQTDLSECLEGNKLCADVILDKDKKPTSNGGTS